MNKILSSIILVIFSMTISFYSYAGEDGELKIKNKNNGQYEVKDCFEKVNRGIFSFNQVLDKAIFRPLAKGYRMFPQPVRSGTSNALNNLSNIVTIPNNVLQGQFKDAGINSARLVINSTLGIAGIFDVASYWKLESEKEDFGQTLAVWGVADGPYIVLPMLGGRNLRDALAFAPDVYLSPLEEIDHVSTRNIIRAIDLIDTRADLIDAEQLVSGDRYGFLRDIYLQTRASSIANGELDDDFGEDF